MGRKGVALVIVLFLVTVPLQLMVQWKVVTGMPPEGAHVHAHAGEHGEGECSQDHADEYSHEEGDDGEGEPRGNLIPNCGFEVGTREQAWGWSPRVRGSSVVFRDEKVKRRGTASGAVAGEADSSGPSGWVFSSLGFPRGEGVTLRGYVLAEVERGGAYLLLRALRLVENEETVPLMEVYQVRDGSIAHWEEVSLEAAVPPEADRLEVEVGFFGRGKAWFDDLTLEVGKAPVLVAGEESLFNASFEQGLDGWLPFGERGEGDRLGVKGLPGGRYLELTSDGGGTWGVGQGVSGLPEQGALRVELSAGSKLVSGEAYLDLFLFYPQGPRRVRVGELSGDQPVRTFGSEIPLEDGLRGAWVAVAVNGVGAVQVTGASLVTLPGD